MRDGYVAQPVDTVARIGQLAEQLGRQVSEFIDVWKLSLSTGVSEEHIQDLLAGRPIAEFPQDWIDAVPEEARDDQVRKLRVRDRLQRLRASRRKGSPWQRHNFADLDEIAASDRLAPEALAYLIESVRERVGDLLPFEEIATGTGLKRQTLHKLFAQKAPDQVLMPALLTADKICAFFGVPEGYLSRSPEDALHEVLKPILSALEREAKAKAEANPPPEEAPVLVSARWRKDPSAPDFDDLTEAQKDLTLDFMSMLVKRARARQRGEQT
ncbi:hypothetical protein ABZ934_30770 [Streptomyces sp. NPDC046557]|uniref:hypothetical protein n=1 Tax=Streptomyces sp. NPDC046557 TaxID=3155372 RepID=UPI0033CBF193